MRSCKHDARFSRLPPLLIREKVPLFLSKQGDPTYVHQILLLFDHAVITASLRLAPSLSGVAVASSILCISTTLNKRKTSQYKILSKIKIHQHGACVKPRLHAFQICRKISPQPGLWLPLRSADLQFKQIGRASCRERVSSPV